MIVQSLIRESELPGHEAERLLRAVTGLDRAQLLTGGSVSAEQARLFDELAARRRAGEPLQYLEGEVPFGPVTVGVDPRVLIPRPETEHLWALAAQRIETPSVVVDLCTGSGALALAAKATWPSARVIAADVSADALLVAEANAAESGLDIEFGHGDLFEGVPPDVLGSVDLLLTNPPYVTESEFDDLPEDVRMHEPCVALVSGPTGLEAIARIGGEAAAWMAVGGEVWCEIGDSQSDAAMLLFTGMTVVTLPDLTGRDRYVKAVRV